MLREPLVSVVTPVYNAEPFLGACIESILNQTYTNFEYTIVNNKSTDNSLAVAKKYAERDSRIKVVSNDKFVGAIENHNVAFSLISNQSKYCKVLCADDWLYHECITKLVEVAEDNPNVGIVGSYAISDRGVRWLGLEPNTAVFSGRDVCRRYLLGFVAPFGTPSTVLYRTDLVRSQTNFYPGSAPRADLSACLSCLRTWDFGLVHQILSFERIHVGQISNSISGVNRVMLDRLAFVHEYGRFYLTADELWRLRDQLLQECYTCIADGICKPQSSEWLDYHRTRLHELGYSLVSKRLARALGVKLTNIVLNPKRTLDKIFLRGKMKEKARNLRKTK